jgi:hypothetical protein
MGWSTFGDSLSLWRVASGDVATWMVVSVVRTPNIANGQVGTTGSFDVLDP